MITGLGIIWVSILNDHLEASRRGPSSKMNIAVVGSGSVNATVNKIALSLPHPSLFQTKTAELAILGSATDRGRIQHDGIM